MLLPACELFNDLPSHEQSSCLLLETGAGKGRDLELLGHTVPASSFTSSSVYKVMYVCAGGPSPCLLLLNLPHD